MYVNLISFFNFHRVYFIVDELFMAGELQETSKKAAIATINQVDQITELEKKMGVVKS